MEEAATITPDILSSMISAKLSGSPDHFNLFKMAANRKLRSRDVCAHHPGAQVLQVGKLVGRWHGNVITPLWDAVIKGDIRYVG